ncbi:MAG TPA: glycosyl hydrolase 108 family protein [Anaeromyxobacter sp.]|nr:glycosyl hydrolase 108 family protein [Anaeromyxobacter sp.]
MAKFEQFLPMLLRFEGGYVDDPDDPGGETNKGVTLAVFQECSRELLGIEPTAENLRNLTDAQAGAIYKARYWDRMHGDDFALQDLANIVCDFYVNAGARATELLQHVMNGMGTAVAEDGAIGPGTLQALAGLPQDEVYRRYKQARVAYYTQLAQARPTLAKFLGGWLNRVDAFPDAPEAQGSAYA